MAGDMLFVIGLLGSKVAQVLAVALAAALALRVVRTLVTRFVRLFVDDDDEDSPQ